MPLKKFHTLACFCEFQRVQGGCTNVQFGSPTNAKVGGRYLSTNEEPQNAGLKEGDALEVYANGAMVLTTYSASTLRKLAENGIKPNDWGSLVDNAELDQVVNSVIKRDEKGGLVPPQYAPSVEQLLRADEILADVTAQELAAAEALWEDHRQFLGGRSSAGQAALPSWSGCKPVPQAAHVVMFRTARRLLAPSGTGT